jgi:hypothetical protein
VKPPDLLGRQGRENDVSFGSFIFTVVS